MTDQEVAQLISCFKGKCKARNTALVSMGIRTGFRVSELMSLSLGDVFKDGEIVDVVTVARRDMKGGYESRSVIVNKKAKADLMEWVKVLLGWGADSSTPLFCSRNLTRLCRRQVYSMLTRAFAKSGIRGKLGTHCMRKTFADRVYNGVNGDLAKLQYALGHKWISSTVRYVSFREDEVHSVINDL